MPQLARKQKKLRREGKIRNNSQEIKQDNTGHALNNIAKSI
jgi:hypothetical protein